MKSDLRTLTSEPKDRLGHSVGLNEIENALFDVDAGEGTDHLDRPQTSSSHAQHSARFLAHCPGKTVEAKKSGFPRIRYPVCLGLQNKLSIFVSACPLIQAAHADSMPPNGPSQ